jgi:hypothetical protein
MPIFRDNEVLWQTERSEEDTAFFLDEIRHNLLTAKRGRADP